MRETVEREIKLAPGEGFVLPELGGERLPTRVFISTYHDTPDLRLAQHGVTLRHRVEDGAGLWQLKLPAGAARLELELPGTPARPPAEMVAMLPAYLRGRDLVPVARLRTRREGVRAQGAEIVDDNVSVLEGQRVARRFREVEVELLEGDERTLRRLEKELAARRSRIGGGATPEALPRARPRQPRRGGRDRSKGACTARGARPRLRAAVPGACSPTIRARAGVTIPRTCISCAWPPGASAHTCAPPGRSLDDIVGGVAAGRDSLARLRARVGPGPRRAARALPHRGRRARGRRRALPARAARHARAGAGRCVRRRRGCARERPLSDAARPDRGRGCAAPLRRGGAARKAVASRGEEDAPDVRVARGRLGGRRAARCPHPGEACALRSRPRSPRARRPG